MNIHKGDLLPALVVTLTDDPNDDGIYTPVDLTTATAVRVIGVMGATVLFNDALTGTSGGVVTRQWALADTDTVGRIVIEIEVTWPGSKPQTFRPPQVVEILPDLA